MKTFKRMIAGFSAFFFLTSLVFPASLFAGPSPYSYRNQRNQRTRPVSAKSAATTPAPANAAPTSSSINSSTYSPLMPVTPESPTAPTPSSVTLTSLTPIPVPPLQLPDPPSPPRVTPPTDDITPPLELYGPPPHFSPPKDVPIEPLPVKPVSLETSQPPMMNVMPNKDGNGQLISIRVGPKSDAVSAYVNGVIGTQVGNFNVDETSGGYEITSAGGNLVDLYNEFKRRAAQPQNSRPASNRPVAAQAPSVTPPPTAPAPVAPANRTVAESDGRIVQGSWRQTGFRLLLTSRTSAWTDASFDPASQRLEATIEYRDGSQTIVPSLTPESFMGKYIFSETVAVRGKVKKVTFRVRNNSSSMNSLSSLAPAIPESPAPAPSVTPAPASPSPILAPDASNRPVAARRIEVPGTWSQEIRPWLKVSVVLQAFRPRKQRLDAVIQFSDGTNKTVRLFPKKAGRVFKVSKSIYVTQDVLEVKFFVEDL